MANMFTDRFRQAMLDKNMKQVDLINIAKERDVKLGKSQISQYVSGKSVPRPKMAEFLAEALEVDVKWLMGSADSMITNDGEMDNSSAIDKGSSIDNDNIADNMAGSSIRNNSNAIIFSEKERNNIMREFKKSSKLDNVLYDVRGPVVEEANRMEASGVNVLKLNIGNPAPFGLEHLMRLYMICRDSLLNVRDIQHQRVFFLQERL